MKQKITPKVRLNIPTLLFILLFYSVGLFGQTSEAVFSWNSQVSCLAYDEDPNRKRFIELIDESQCLRVCENSQVTYSINGPSISQIEWFATGQQSAFTSPNQLNFTVLWGDNGSGSVHFIVTLNNGNQISKTVCIEKLISPKAKFAIISNQTDLTFCEETPLFFTNLSTDNGGSSLVTYLWDFGDGTFSNEFQPTHTYDTSGSYQVTLTVTNECNCSSTFSEIINISKLGFDIGCLSVACENSTQTYSAPVNFCERYYWDVIGGSILNDNSSSIDVLWDNVDDSGFGYVQAMDMCSQCPSWVTVKIPIIKSVGVISGDETLCLSEQKRYSLPQWPGTFFEWSLIDLDTNLPADGLLVTDQINEVVVTALQPGTYLLKASYFNELIGCGGNAELTLTIKREHFINGNFIVCKDETGSYQSSISNTSWQLFFNNSLVGSGFGSTFQYLFAQSGIYRLVTTSPVTCTDEKFITVYDANDFEGDILGEVLACPGVTYEYAFPPVGSTFVLNWSVDGGIILGSNQGSQVNIMFNEQVPQIGYYTVKVTKQLNQSPFCESEPIVLFVYPKEMNVVIQNIDQESEFCPSSFTSFSFTFDFMNEVENINWRIESIMGNSSFGNILSGQGTDNIQVSWNEISDSNQGFVFVDVRFCGRVETFSYPISLFQIPVIQFTDGINTLCSGSSNAVSWVISSSIPIQSGTIVWSLENGTTVEQIISSTSTSFTSPQMFFPNTNTSNIQQQVTATIINANACNNNVSVTKNITLKPSPIITISPGYNYNICPDSSGQFSVTLTANLQGGITTVGGIQWFKMVNNVPQQIFTGISNNGINLTITEQLGLGQYFAQATADNGCTERSRIISLMSLCLVPQGCDLGFTPTVSASLTTPHDCTTFEIVGNYTHTPADIRWFLPPIHTGLTLVSSTNMANQTIGQFSVTTPGNYLIFYEVGYDNGNGDLCYFSDFVEINVPFIADLRYELSCLGNGLHQLSLFDNSTHILTPAEFQQQQYTFFINQVAQPNPNNQNFLNVSNLSPGVYSIGLQISNPMYPDITTCYNELSIELFAAPDTQFTIVHDPNCVEQAVFLTLNSAVQEGFQYRWSFDNTSFVVPPTQVGQFTTVINLGINPQQNETTPITLTITDPNGCVHTQQISTDEVVSQAIYEMDIVGGGPYCVGEAVLLSLQNNLPSNVPVGFQWMRGSQPIAGATGATYAPTISGNYWVILYNDQGCSFTSIGATAVSFFPATHVSINAPATVCAHTPFTLNAQVSGAGTVESRWLLNGVPLGIWSVNTNHQLTQTLGAGTFVYRLEVRDATTGSCFNFAEFTVQVIPTPTVQAYFNILECEPYLIELTAQASVSGGTFLWSNGQNGSTIYVSHGGAYQVTYLANTGCSTTYQIFVPKHPEVYTWVFPTGCYSICGQWLENGIEIPAPNASFDEFTWYHEHVAALNGSEYSPNFQLTHSSGAYHLSLTNEFCTATSGYLELSSNDCPDCDLFFAIERVLVEPHPYLSFLIQGTLFNPFSTNVSVEISAPNNDGIYVPSTVFIPASGSFNFMHLVFIPNASYVFGNPISFRVTFKDESGRILCTRDSSIDVRRFISAKINRFASFDFYPNPATEQIFLKYELEEEEKGSIEVYDLNGRLRNQFVLHQTKGTHTQNVSHLPSGQYIIVLKANGNPVSQHILIKK